MRAAWGRAKLHLLGIGVGKVVLLPAELASGLLLGAGEAAPHRQAVGAAVARNVVTLSDRAGRVIKLRP